MLHAGASNPVTTPLLGNTLGLGVITKCLTRTHEEN